MRRIFIAAAAIGVAAGAALGGAALVNAVQPDTPNVNVLPSQVPVAGPDGNVVGYADRDELMRQPTAAQIANANPNAPIDVYNGKPGAAVRDTNGKLVGWAVPGQGFMTQQQWAAWKASQAQAQGNGVERRRNADGSETVIVNP